jgi:hypothetical protein
MGDLCILVERYSLERKGQNEEKGMDRWMDRSIDRQTKRVWG